MGVDSHLVIDGSESVGLADAIGDEGGVVDAAGHVAIITGEQQHVVEVEITSLKHTHDLDTFCRFSMKGDGGGLDQLTDESLQSNDIYVEHATIDEVRDTIE